MEKKENKRKIDTGISAYSVQLIRGFDMLPWVTEAVDYLRELYLY